MAEQNKKHPSEESGSGQLDYGANKPTGGTNTNTGKINPQAPTSGTENFHPDRKKDQQTTADSDSPLDSGRNAQNWTSREIPLPSNAAGNYSYSCADAGNSDCRWEVASASGDELWADIERHYRDVHGKPTLDEVSRGRIQDAIHVRRAP